MKSNIDRLVLCVWVSLCSSLLYGWNNQHWLGNSERVIRWEGTQPADYLRLGVLKDGVYSLSAVDIATAFGITTNSALVSLAAGEFRLTCGTNSIAWSSDGAALYFPGARTSEHYAPENVYFLRQAPGKVMDSRSAPPVSGGTNLWFMESNRFRSDFLSVTAYYDRRSTNASITNASVFGMSLGNGYCNRLACAFTAALPGYQSSAATNLQLIVHAISYGDFNKAGDTHRFETLVNNVSCGTNSWSGEQLVRFPCATALTSVPNDHPQVRITNLTPAQHFLLLDVEVEYPRTYQVGDEPLLCSGGVQSNIAVGGGGSNTAARIWDVTDPLAAVVLDTAVRTHSNGWSTVFSCGNAASRYAVFEAESCFQPSVTGFKDINWSAAGEIPELVIVTPPRRWVSGFEQALEPLVALRRRQRLSVRVIDAEEIYNAFSYGLVSPHAFPRFVAAGVNSGAAKPLRYLLFAGYASTDYGLEVFFPDTVFRSGKKGFPALFPLLQVYQHEFANNAYEQLLLPNDMMLGDADGNGVPDIVVGRFLAPDAAELSNMVAKTIVHDTPHVWNQALIVSDWDGPPDKYFNFTQYCAGLATSCSNAGWSVTHYPCKTDAGFTKVWQDTYYETGLSYDFPEGRDLFYFLGHSSDTLMGHGSGEGRNVFDRARMTAADWSYPPFAMALGCRMARYTSLDVVGLDTCLIERAVKNPSSAFCSIISAAGYLGFGEAKELSTLFAAEVSLYGARTVGDAYLAVLSQMGAADLISLRHLVLLGDPSMPIRRVKYGSVLKIE